MSVVVQCSNPDCRASITVTDGATGATALCRACGATVSLYPTRDDLPAIDEPPAGEFGIGSLFAGRYRVEKELGRGGMGSVYLAYDQELDRRVALKIPTLLPGDGPEMLLRFTREARAAAGLKHPNICQVYDVGQFGGTRYLTMEYVEGQSLKDVLLKKRPGPRQAAALVATLAKAIAYAHSKGVVHRDLKPANVMASQSGDLVVMDFGLARRTESDDSRLTKTGALLGTPAYMAPEQVDGDMAAIGPCTDVYALGVMLYEMLAGRLPFLGPTTSVLVQIKTKEPEALESLAPGVDQRLAAVAMRAMAKEPADRYATMGELAEALAIVEIGPKNPVADPSGPDVPTSGSRSDKRGSAPPAGRGVDRAEPLAAAPPGHRTVRATRGAQPAPRPAPRATAPPPRRWLPIALGVGLPMLVAALGIVVYWKTDLGTVKVTVNRADAVAYVDGQELRVEGEGLDLRLRAGTHRLMVRSGNVVAEAPQSFEVKRGEETVVTVEFPADPEPTAPGPAEPPAPAVAAAPDPEVEKDAAPLAAAPAPKPADVPPPSPAPPKSLTNSVGMTLVRIAPGSFLMGSPDSDKDAQDDEKPQHRVEITRPYYLSAYEVTQEQYQKVMGTNPSYFAATGGGKDKVKGVDTSTRPVEQVSWLDAVAFCNALSRKEGLAEYYRIDGTTVTIPDAAGKGYRLPTEAEWEYACRAGTTTRYQHGDDPAGLARVGNLGASDGAVYTAAVGGYEANAWGLYDLHGNVWEWCWDGYDSGYYAQSPAADPAGPVQATYRVIRGGSWLFEPRDARSAYRNWNAPGYRSSYLGFRVARGPVT